MLIVTAVVAAALLVLVVRLFSGALSLSRTPSRLKP